MGNVNWIQEIRKMKRSSDEDLTITVSWKNRTFNMSRKPVAQFSTDREVINAQFAMLGRMISMVEQYKKSLRDNYGQLFLTLAEDYAKETRKIPPNAAAINRCKTSLNKLTEEIVNADDADENEANRILVEEELDNICKEQ